MTQTVYGTKYEATKGLSTTEIAKEIRKDIKALVTLGVLPKGTKTSVKTRYFAGGSSIDVEITALPGVPVFNPEWLLAQQNGDSYGGLNRYSDQARAAVKAVEAVVDAYNFDGSDIQTDYFHVRFYGSVKIDYDLENNARVTEYAEAHGRAVRESFIRLAIKNMSFALHNLAKACEAHANFVPDLSGLTRETRPECLPSVGHKDFSGVYGCPATFTAATFKANGLIHIARRLWRSDVPGTGRIELHLVEPGTENEDFFRYVNEFEPSRVDIQAIAAIKAADPSYNAPASFDFVQRVQNLELT